MDIHNYKRRFERTLQRIEEDKTISQKNKEVMFKFKDYCLSEGIGVAKIERYLGDVVKYSKMLKKAFPEANKEDIRRVVAELEQTDLSAETKKCFKIMLRKLYRLIEGIDEKGVYPERVKWISIAIPKNHRKLPEELLTEEEMLAIVQKCMGIRNKALIMTLAESGCRVSEVGTMKIKHISFEKYGARLTVQGKTGARKILVVNSCPYLQEWVNQHPDNNNLESYLWISSKGTPLSYARISTILKRAAQRAGIKKRIHPHLLRHSRATILAQNPKMSPPALNYYMGWIQGSEMANTYIHISGKDTDAAILDANGIELSKKKEKPVMKPKKCLKCKTINEVTNRFCKICGLPLNKEEAERIIKIDTDRSRADEIMNRIINDPKIWELIKAKLNQSYQK